MFFDGMLETEEAVPFGLTYYEGEGLPDGVMTGNTLARQLEGWESLIGEGFQRLGERIAGCDVAEAQNLEQGQHGARIEDVVRPMRDVQQAMGVDLVHSKPVDSPRRFSEIFRENPERLLSNVTPLKSTDFEERLLQDPTIAPVIFDKWGVKFVGWIKTGLLDASFDTHYRPQVARMIAGSPVPWPRRAPQPPRPALPTRQAAEPPANLVQPPHRPAGQWLTPRIKTTQFWQVILPAENGDHAVAPVEAMRDWFGFRLIGPGNSEGTPIRIDFTKNQHFRVLFTVSVSGRRLQKGFEHTTVTDFPTPAGAIAGDLQVGTIHVQRHGPAGLDNYSITKVVDRHGSGPALGLLAVVVQNDDIARRGGDGVLSVWKPV